MKSIEYQVWAIPPKHDELQLINAYHQQRWQWAMKYAGLLRDSGYKEVTVVDIEIEDEEAPPAEDAVIQT